MKIYILKIESVILKHDLVKYKLRTYLSCLNHYIDMTPNQFLPNVFKKWKVNGAKQVSYFGQNIWPNSVHQWLSCLWNYDWNTYNTLILALLEKNIAVMKKVPKTSWVAIYLTV